MEDHLSLTSITTLATIALICGLGLYAARLPALIGYIVAGVVLGPSGLALVKSTETINLFAELGVLLLLFLLGMEVSLRAFKTVLGTVLLCAVLQAAVALAITMGLSYLFAWPVEQAIVLGFVLALSSTAVGVKMLEDIGEIRTEVGRITIGVLIGQDLLIVPMLVVVQSLGSEEGVGIGLAVRLVVSVGVLAGVIAFLSRRTRLRLPGSRLIRRNHDIGPLAMLVFCFVAATATGLMGLSASYGAFIAGLVIGSSTDRKAAIHALRPLQSVLLMVFFLSVGLLINVPYILANWFTVVVLLLLVTVAKTAANIFILNGLGQPWRRAFLSGLVMAQIGEFSFVIAAAGLQAGALAGDGYTAALSVIALSLIVSPFWLMTARRLEEYGQVRVQGMRQTFAMLYESEIDWVSFWSRRLRRKAGDLYDKAREAVPVNDNAPAEPVLEPAPEAPATDTPPPDGPPERAGRG